MIDKKYFELNMGIYFRDLLLMMATFVGGFIGCLNTSGVPFVLLFIVATISIHRAGIFLHEIAHHPSDRRMKGFKIFWNLTVGAVIMLPSARFYKPHQIHHAIGTFATKDDPQYMLLRSDRKLAIIVLGIIPAVMPLVSILLMLSSSFFGVRAEEVMERFVERHGQTTGSVMADRHKREVTWYSRYYLAVWVAYCLLFPETLPVLFSILVAGWYLTTLRIPMEHSMIRYLETSDRRTHMIDSYTVESPLGILTQPIGLRFHTAHHLYPGVPYHNLKALHYDLKEKDPEYRKSCVSFWQAIKGPDAAPV